MGESITASLLPISAFVGTCRYSIHIVKKGAGLPFPRNHLKHDTLFSSHSKNGTPGPNATADGKSDHAHAHEVLDRKNDCLLPRHQNQCHLASSLQVMPR